MRGEFKRLPKVLKKNILCKIGLGLSFLIGFVFMCIFMEYLIFALVPAAFAMFLLMDGIDMMFRCISGEYVEVQGICKEVHRTAVRRRTRLIIIETKRGTLRLPIRIKRQSIKVGDSVTVYIPDHASVYDHKGDMVVCEFYGVEIIKKRGET